MAGGTVRQVADAAGSLAAAHRALRADPAVQFDLTPVPPPPEPPHWFRDLLRWLGDALRPVGRLLRWIAGLVPDAPYARILLWTAIAALAALFLWVAADRVRHGRWRLPGRRRRPAAAVDVPDEPWQPEAAPVRRWLDEADALAGAGRYAEAVHHLLFRSVEDIGRRRPGAVRPALTSRELARADAIPAAARAPFASIARLVERSLFGGRPVDAADWGAARAAYADLARPGIWRHG